MAECTKPANKNWLLIKFREYHSWLGVFLSLFIITVCLTGIYLNHKNLFEAKKDESGDKPRAAEKKPESKGALTTTMSVGEVPVTMQQALAKAEESWGDSSIEFVQLKEEKGKLVYKIKRAEDKEMIVDARSGEVIEKDGYFEKTMAAGGGKGKEGYNWGKILKDVHTGKVGALPGKLFVDFISVVIVLLTLTGMYLWAVPKLRKRRKQQEQAARESSAKQLQPV